MTSSRSESALLSRIDTAPLAQLGAARDSSTRILRQLERQCEDLARNGKTLPGDVLTGLVSLSESLEQLKSSFEAQEQEAERLYAVASVGQIVNSSLDLTTVLNEVMDTIIA